MTVFLERFARRGFDPSLFSPKYDNEGSKRILHYHTLAEREGFEPSWERLTPHSISSRRRYGHFGTSPFKNQIIQKPRILAQNADKISIF